MVRRLLAPVLILGLVPATVSAQSFSTAAILKNLKVQQTSPADWQQKYDAAKAKKDGSKMKIFIGLAMVGGGSVIAATGGASCSSTIVSVSCGSNNSTKLGLLVDAGGSGVFIWGLVEYFDANSELDRLSAQKGTKSPTTTLSLTDHQALQLSVGVRPSIGYRLSW